MRRRHQTRTIVAIAAMTAAVALALAGLTASAAPAKGGANGFKVAKFKVEVKGVQKMVQQYHHLAENECDIDNFSSGSEKIVFETLRPVVITASYSPAFENPMFFTNSKVLGIPTRATVKRSYTSRIHGPAKPCEENGGGVETVLQPDCGTKRIEPYVVQLQYADAKKGQLIVTGDTGAEDPFERCAGAGEDTFPFLLGQKGASGKQLIHAELPQRDLFDPGFQKWISLAEGSRKTRYADHWIKTDIQWDVSFTRLK